MSEQPTLYLVQIPIQGRSSFDKYSAPDVKSLGLQVWLLKRDGTTVHQQQKPTMIGIGNAGWDTDYMEYTFNKVPSDELAGIILQVKGKLYCSEITTNIILPADTPLNALCGRWQSEQGDSFEFLADGTYEHWQQVPPVSKLAQAEASDTSSRINLSKGRFQVDFETLAFHRSGGKSGTNQYYIIKDHAVNDKGKFFQNGLSLFITQIDGSKTNYDLMYR